MSAQKPTATRALSAFAAFLGMSVVAGLLVTAAVTPAIAVTGMAASDSIGVFEGLPEYLQIDSLAQNSTIYANQGGKPIPIATFYAQNRVEVGWKDISQNMKDASIATEDPHFYQHGGIDLMGTLRGALSTYVLHKDTQGGSSITQQYVKNVLVQKCEVKNIVVEDSNAAEQKKKQAAQDKAYQNCYLDATAATPDRKLNEMKMAIGLEKKYSKNAILQSYLNITGFGGKVYGVEAAAHYYFNTTAKDLNLEQAATLTAILNNPANLRIDQDKATNPGNNAENGFKATLDRRNYVIDRMYINHKITLKQHDDAKKTKIAPTITPVQTGCMSANAVNAGAFCDLVQRTILNDPAFGKTVDERVSLFNRGGLKIYSTLNLDLQGVAQQSLNAVVPATLSGTDIGGTNVSVEVGTGRIVTMVQNRPFNNTDTPTPGTTAVNYNEDATYGSSQGFQTGSTWKAFDLVEWLKEGHSLNDIIDGTRHSYPQSAFHSGPACNDIGGAAWNVTNDDGAAGRMSVMTGTAESVNTVFAMMSTKLDLCGIKQSAQQLLVKGADETANPFLANPSSVLGTNYIAPISMATAYAGLANGGKACSAIAIDKITDPTGKDIAVPKSVCSTNPVDPKVAAGVVYALQGVIRNGTATRANPGDGVPIFAKTGTTDNSYDNWLVSSTTKVATATWVGNVASTLRSNGTWTKTPIRNLTLGGQYGGNAKLIVAKPILAALNAAYGGAAFPAPDSSVLNAKQITVPDLTGKSPADAQSLLTGLGFTYQDGGPVDSAAAAGTVASTNPGAGASAGLGSTVIVYTSNGSLVALPDVTGKSAADAIAALTGAGFGYAYNGDPAAIIASTNPAPGTPTKPGTKVTLTAKPNNTPGPGNGNNGGGTGG
ncbi:MAG TPA: transglycosylase domain-containing protein [Microbacteriaceae bacterium]